MALYFRTQAARPVMYLLINALAFFFFLYLLSVFRDHKRRRGLPYPPGPPSRPILGNLLDIPKDTPWAAYADISKKYGRREHSRDACLHKLKFAFQGDVICFRVFNQVIIVLCSLSATKDLLEKRGEIYSDRPTLPILEMYIVSSRSSAIITFPISRIDMDWFVPNMGMSEFWREGRKLLDRSLRPGAAMLYRQMMQEKTCWFLAQLFASPKDFHHHIELSPFRLPHNVRLLTTKQPSGETHHVTYLWLRP